jgi:hypothetical protein
MAYVVVDMVNDTEEILCSDKCCASCNCSLENCTTYAAGASQICVDCAKQEAAKYHEHVMPRLETY